MAKVNQVTSFEIIDSRGNPTAAAEVVLADGARGFGAARPAHPPDRGKYSSCAMEIRSAISAKA
jgi:enolase